MDALETKLAALESALAHMREHTDHEKKVSSVHETDTSQGSRSIKEGDDSVPSRYDAHPFNLESKSASESASTASKDQVASLEISTPSSIYVGILDNVASFESLESSVSDSGLKCKLSRFDQPTLNVCLDLFFQFHNGGCQIVDRELFMSQYRAGTRNSLHMIPPLLHSMCALGALSSCMQDSKQIGEELFQSAISSIADTTIFIPRLSTFQTLLCCSLFAFGRNRPKQGWAYSGPSPFDCSS